MASLAWEEVSEEKEDSSSGMVFSSGETLRLSTAGTTVESPLFVDIVLLLVQSANGTSNNSARSAAR